MRGKQFDNWMHIHTKYIELWHHRGSHIVPLHWEQDEEYITWYMRHSRPHLFHTGIMLSIMTQQMRDISVRSERGDPSELQHIAGISRRGHNFLREFIPMRLYGRAEGPVDD
ncbi:hypothetical protein MLD38_019482 [Melastoma candidum]|uniref:Uncharacterized protein n=1 Tax=Melastoma candidum TaxID=119954 RepID=A0ACB9QXC2_9MYRT|nr:hypothetical protein MLD38_019482 [Melastoma candidum]